ncbi:MAG: hypothetical protein JO337_10445 [Acidimicrobiales bacterium]|nr:hypothetical protein [Acidimicrobiales bacterium]
MRARLMMKVMSLLVMVVLTVISARSCSGGSDHSSPLDPTNVARNGIAGLCANQQATATASGDGAGSQGLDLSQAAAGNPAGLNALSQALGGQVSCPTTTVGPDNNGG